MNLSAAGFKRLVLLMVLAVVVIWAVSAWGRRLDRLNAELDRQTAAALETGRRWRATYAAVHAASRLADQRAQAARQQAAAQVATSDTTASTIERLRGDSAFWSDSAAAWHWLYDLRTDEVRSLRSAYVIQGEALALITADRDRWRTVADSAYQVSLVLETALRAERDARRCRMLGLVPCPSRTAVAIGSAIVTLVASEIVHRSDAAEGVAARQP